MEIENMINEEYRERKGVIEIPKTTTERPGFREEDNETPEKLLDWLDLLEPKDEFISEIDATLEWLKDSGMLNVKGEKFEYAFWKRYIKK